MSIRVGRSLRLLYYMGPSCAGHDRKVLSGRKVEVNLSNRIFDEKKQVAERGIKEMMNKSEFEA